DPDNPNHVYKLKKALYELKQAPRACFFLTLVAVQSSHEWLSFSSGSGNFLHWQWEFLLTWHLFSSGSGKQSSLAVGTYTASGNSNQAGRSREDDWSWPCFLGDENSSGRKNSLRLGIEDGGVIIGGGIGDFSV
nr:retrotransposon protein, putative, Ty1-copia subclass [Tanacetum cinerariifolium]